jgi:hypothetical protein
VGGRHAAGLDDGTQVADGVFVGVGAHVVEPGEDEPRVDGGEPFFEVVEAGELGVDGVDDDAYIRVMFLII